MFGLASVRYNYQFTPPTLQHFPLVLSPSPIVFRGWNLAPLVDSSLYWLPTLISSIVDQFAVLPKIRCQSGRIANCYRLWTTIVLCRRDLLYLLLGRRYCCVMMDRSLMTSTLVISDLSNRFLVVAFRGQFWTTSNPTVVVVTAVIRSTDWDPRLT